MGNFFSDLFKSKDPEIITKTVTDPSKVAVNNPLSSFLANNVGAGLPRYPGELGAELPQGGGASVSPFLSKTVDQLYGDISNSARADFKNTYSDLLEGSAGALSSSSRAYNDNTAVTNLSLGLADKRAALELGLPAAQLDAASKIQAINAQNNALQYQDWLKSLPEYNPILGNAISYLSNQTGTGTTVLSALDPGKNAGIFDLIKAGAQAGATAVAAGA